MATRNRNPSAPLVIEFLARPQDFDFFAAVQFLERLCPDKAEVGCGATPGSEAVRISTSAALAFPSSDIANAVWSPNSGQYHLTATFLGLYGVSSPLPSYLFQIAAGDSEGAASLRDFLNIFGQRLYALYYRAWKKNRLPDGRERSPDRAAEFLSAVAGLAGSTQPAGLSGRRILASAGLFASAVRSARGLERVLQHYFRIPVQTVERVAHWRPNPSPLHLGDLTNKLGRSAALGSSVRDVAGTFRAALGPLHINDAHEFLPGAASHIALTELVRRWVTDFLTCEYQIGVYGAEAPAVVLGKADAPLGHLSWLGKPETDVCTVSFGRFETY